MDIRPIKTEQDYENALEEIENLIDAEAETEDGDRLDILVTLVEAWEERHYIIEAPDPVEAVRFALESRGLEEADLKDIIHASRQRVWEIMNKKRHLSIQMIRRLHKHLKIPADVLIRSYEAG